MFKGCLIEIKDENYKFGIYLSYDYNNILSKKHRVLVGNKIKTFHKENLKEISCIPQSNNYGFGCCYWCLGPLKTYWYFKSGPAKTYYCPKCLR